MQIIINIDYLSFMNMKINTRNVKSYCTRIIKFPMRTIIFITSYILNILRRKRNSTNIDIIKKINKDEYVSRWKFWKIYIDYGLNGSIFNLFILNPIALVIILFESIFNIITTYAMTVVTKTLHINTINPINHDNHMSDQFYIFIVLLIIIIFSSDITKICKNICKKRLDKDKYAIIKRIMYAIDNVIKSAEPEIINKFNINEQYDARTDFNWIYINVTESIMNIVINVIHSMIFCSYVIYQEPRLLFVLMAVYSCVWYFLIPYINKKNKQCITSVTHWRDTYYCVATEQWNKDNPLYMLLNENISQVSTNSVEKFIDIVKYYDTRNDSSNDSRKILNIIQNTIILIIMCILFKTEQYITAITVLMNQSSIFGIINTYNNMKGIEECSERSIEKIIKILDAIDKHNLELDKKGIEKPEQFINNNVRNERMKIISIDIEYLNINIPVLTKKEEEEKEEEEKECNIKIVNINDINDINDIDVIRNNDEERNIYLEKLHIKLEKGKVLLIDGKTNCGKTLLNNIFAGKYTGKKCRSMFIRCADGRFYQKEFNEIRSAMCYINQGTSEEYTYDGSIAISLAELFPGTKHITEVRDFLIDVFCFDANSIPGKLNDHPHSNLSGGERQRYAVASQIWKARIVEPDFIIMDEIDRALDKETAIKIMTWIIDNIPSFFIITSHLTEVKNALYIKSCIDQILNYDLSDIKRIKIIPKIVEY